MADTFGSDFITIEDESGTEYELEVLTSMEYNGQTYLAVIPASEGETEDYSVIILKSSEENGENILSILEDEAELQSVYDRIMDLLYEDE